LTNNVVPVAGVSKVLKSDSWLYCSFSCCVLQETIILVYDT